MLIASSSAPVSKELKLLFRYRYDYADGDMPVPNVAEAIADPKSAVRSSSMVASKLIFDIVVTVPLVLLLTPLFLIIMAILASGEGPIFYAQSRIGRNGRSFPCLKFTTMVPDAERLLGDLLASDPVVAAEWAEHVKLRNDPRITAIGRFLRRTSLDELPQLLNVLCGHMSLVGPRPIADYERERWAEHYDAYIAIRPGVTGPWQINHRNETEYSERFASLEHYLANWSMLGDCKYLLLTTTVPFSRHGAY
jgi:lipopolysaccharide/colanic/teichoic acid biosynthesis glycosyltransferase